VPSLVCCFHRVAVCCSTVELLPRSWWRRVESNHLVCL